LACRGIKITQNLKLNKLKKMAETSISKNKIEKDIKKLKKK